MDEDTHVYELDIGDLLLALASQLTPRGYHIRVNEQCHMLRIETSWRPGAAQGEIGSMLYALVAQKLREIER